LGVRRSDGSARAAAYISPADGIRRPEGFPRRRPHRLLRRRLGDKLGVQFGDLRAGSGDLLHVQATAWIGARLDQPFPSLEHLVVFDVNALGLLASRLKTEGRPELVRPEVDRPLAVVSFESLAQIVERGLITRTWRQLVEPLLRHRFRRKQTGE